MAKVSAGQLDRRVVVDRLLKYRKNALIVTGLGAPTYDVAAVGDDDRNFYLWGAMGGAAMVGLGLALAQPDKPVLVITGDGEMMMGLGALATIGSRQPSNLTIVIIDNERFGETGGQLGHTALCTDLVAVAKACGLEKAQEITTLEDVECFATRVEQLHGPLFVSIKVGPKIKPKVLPTTDGIELKNRFRRAVSNSESNRTEFALRDDHE